MVAQARTAPALKRPHAKAFHSVDPAIGQKHVVDVICGAVLRTVHPVQCRNGLPTVKFVANGVTGTDKTETLQRVHRGHAIDAPSRFVPNGVAVEVARNDGWMVGQKWLVPAQRRV